MVTHSLWIEVVSNVCGAGRHLNRLWRRTVVGRFFGTCRCRSCASADGCGVSGSDARSEDRGVGGVSRGTKLVVGGVRPGVLLRHLPRPGILGGAPGNESDSPSWSKDRPKGSRVPRAVGLWIGRMQTRGYPPSRRDLGLRSAPSREQHRGDRPEVAGATSAQHMARCAVALRALTLAPAG